MRCPIAIVGLLSFLLVATQPAPAATPEQFDRLIADAKGAMLADPNVAIVKAQDAERWSGSRPPSTDREIMRATAQWLQGEGEIP